jgi:hypothetical protein
MIQPAITQAAVAAIAAEVARYGAAGVETGGFLLVPRSNPTVTTVAAMAGATGMVRRPDQFVISAAAVDVLSGWADDHDLRIAAQFHAHGGAAFLSPIDGRGGVRVDGFISAVVPTFRTPPAAATAWAWFAFRDGAWRPRPALPTVTGGIGIVAFDEDGTSDQ